MPKITDLQQDEGGGKLITVSLSRWRWASALNGAEVKLVRRRKARNGLGIFAVVKVRMRGSKADRMAMHHDIGTKWRTMWLYNIDMRLIDRNRIVVRIHSRQP